MMPTPARGTKINRAKIIATVVRTPSLLLPSPGPDAINMSKDKFIRNASKPHMMVMLTAKADLLRNFPRVSNKIGAYHQRDCHRQQVKCTGS